MNDHRLWLKGFASGVSRLNSHSVIVCCVLRRLRILNRLQLHGCNAQEETGLFGHWRWRQAIRCPLNYASFVTVFRPRSMALDTDWRYWLGKSTGLTPSHDDTLSGMLLAAWYYGALDARAGRPFACSDNLQLVTTAVSVELLTLCRARIFRLAHPALCPCSELPETYRCCDRFAAGAGAYVRGRYAAGVLAWPTIITRKTMKTLVVALGATPYSSAVRR